MQKINIKACFSAFFIDTTSNYVEEHTQKFRCEGFQINESSQGTECDMNFSLRLTDIHFSFTY